MDQICFTTADPDRSSRKGARVSDRPSFSLEELRVFEQVARSGGFTSAASMLGTSQSSVSQQVGRLEATLGHKLFDRTSRSVRLTPSGESLLIYARAILSLTAQTMRHFSQPGLSGPLRLGIVEDFAASRLPLILSMFRRQHPNFALNLVTGPSSHLLNELEADRLEIVLSMQLSGRAGADPLWSEPLIWVGDPSIVSDDVPIPLVAWPDPSEPRRAMFDALMAVGRTWTVVAESSGVTGIHAAVASGFGITALARRFIPANLGPVPPEAGLPLLPSVDYVVARHGSQHKEVIDAFVAMIRAANGGIGDGPAAAGADD